jgi:hypothetical protein
MMINFAILVWWTMELRDIEGNTVKLADDLLYMMNSNWPLLTPF